MMPKKIIVIGALLVFGIAPAFAFGAAYAINHSSTESRLSPQVVSKADLQKALDKENNSLDENDRRQKITVLSYKLYEHVWYIVSLTYTDGSATPSHPSIALVGNLRGDTNKLSVILKPEEVFPHVNISEGQGVPYTVIDAVNEYYQKRSGEGE
jgi:hypothetical protein